MKYHWQDENGKWSAYKFFEVDTKVYRFFNEKLDGSVAYFQIPVATDPTEEEAKKLAYSYPAVYTRKTAATKCVRCGRPGSENRLDLNNAHMCDRCYDATKNCDENCPVEGQVWYYINEDGSKGSLIK